MRTVPVVPVCALDSVDAATIISAPAKMAAPNFMVRKKPSIVVSHQLLLLNGVQILRPRRRVLRGKYNSPDFAFAKSPVLESTTAKSTAYNSLKRYPTPYSVS